MASLFTKAADKLDDLSAIFEARSRDAEPLPITASQCADIAAGLKNVALTIRIGDGLTVVLRPFTVVEGGRQA